MKANELVHWLKGFISGVHHYNLTPAQWDTLREEIEKAQPDNTDTSITLTNTGLSTTSDVSYNKGYYTTTTG